MHLCVCVFLLDDFGPHSLTDLLLGRAALASCLALSFLSFQRRLLKMSCLGVMCQSFSQSAVVASAVAGPRIFLGQAVL